MKSSGLMPGLFFVWTWPKLCNIPAQQKKATLNLYL